MNVDFVWNMSSMSFMNVTKNRFLVTVHRDGESGLAFKIESYDHLPLELVRAQLPTRFLKNGTVVTLTNLDTLVTVSRTLKTVTTVEFT